MNLASARIGYAGYSNDLSAPGDRRRFCAYARLKGLGFERADAESDYDLVIVTHNGDIAGWTARKKRAGERLKFVFELADSYFVQTGLARRFLKGSARYALGMDDRFSPDFLKTLIRACEAADSVICSTEEQAATIRCYNKNCFTSFDYFADDIGQVKRTYKRGKKLKLVWEGQSTTLDNLATIRDVLNGLAEHIELHVVTDPFVHRHFGRFLPQPSTDLLKTIRCEMHFHNWAREDFYKHIASCDLAIIPIDARNSFALGKPENKLVMLWLIGMPVLASDTPAYRRAMAGAGLEMLCKDPDSWREKLEDLLAAPAQHFEGIARKGQLFARVAYSREAFLDRFDDAFAAAGFDVNRSANASTPAG